MKIHKADIPEDKTEKIVARLNEAMDKYQIEKVYLFTSALFPANNEHSTGCSYVRQEEVRRRVWRNLALCDRTKFWLLNHPRH